jgi:hypothetical protein
MSFAVAAQADDLSGLNITIVALLHTGVVLFHVTAITLPKPSRHAFEKDILMALIHMCNLAVAPCFVVLQFYAQYQEMRAQHGNPER